MDNNFLNMMKLFSYGATGKEIGAPTDLDFDRVMKYAEDQGIWEIVFFAIEQLYKQGKINTDKHLIENVTMQMIFSCLKNSERLAFSHKILREFKKENIKYCVIKGETLSKLYYKPECRISSDVDVYIGNENEKKACKILNDFGYRIEPKSDDANHYSCFHPDYGEMELHVTLYYKIIQDTWFQNISFIEEPYVEYEDYCTLGYTDGCINVALHAINHFLSSGFGLRHVMDFLLYIEKYYDKIDIERFENIMKKLKYYRFIGVMIGVGEIYFGIDRKLKAEYTQEAVEKLLNEIYLGGVFGHKNKAGRTFDVYTSMKIAKSKNTNTDKYMTSWRRKNAIKALSFAPSKMYINYPYAQENHLLLPVAWCNHIGHIFKTAFTRKRLVGEILNYKAPEITPEAQRKIDLFKELDMI